MKPLCLVPDLLEVAGGEGETGAESGVPVFPCVATITHTEFAGDELTAHFSVESDVLVKEEIIVAYVNKPTECAQLRLYLVGGLLDKFDGIVVMHGIHRVRSLVVGVDGGSVGGQPSAHGVARGEHVGVTLSIDGAAAATHGQSAHGAVLLVAYDMITLFDGGDKLSIEECLKGPVLHVEIAVYGAARVGATSIGHDDDHRNNLASAEQFVGDDVHLPFLDPGLIIIGESMQQVKNGILDIVGGIVAIGQPHVKLYSRIQYVRLNAVSDNFGF